MKIFILNDDFPPQSNGGAAIVAYRLAQQLYLRGHEIQVVSSHRSKNKIEEREGILIHWLQTDYNLRWRSYISLKNKEILDNLNELFIQEKPDVVHVHNIHTYLSYAAIAQASKLNIPVVYTGHDVMPAFYNRLTQFIDVDCDGILETLDLKAHWLKQAWQQKLNFNPLRNLFIRFYLSQAYVVTVSDALKEVYETNGIRVSQVITNGFESSGALVSSKKTTVWREQHKLSDKKIIFFAGRIRRDKGVFHVLELLPKLKESVVIVIAGRLDKRTEALKKRAQEKEVDQRLILLGKLNQDELAVAYKASDVVWAGSVCFDSFPNTVVEAMAYEKPVIASPYGGAKEIVEHEVNGYVINPFDPKETLLTLEKALSNSKEIKQLQQRAKQKVEQKLSYKIWIDQHESLYRKLSR